MVLTTYNEDELNSFLEFLDFEKETLTLLDFIKQDIGQLKKNRESLLFTPSGQRIQFDEGKQPFKELSNNNTRSTLQNGSLQSLTSVVVKQEKPDNDVEEKENQVGIMPPPAAKPARGRPKKVKNEPVDKPVRQSRSQAIKEEIRMTITRPSDVILQKEHVPVVDLNSSSETDTAEAIVKPIVNSKLKTSDERKRCLSQSSEDVPALDTKTKASKRTKRKKVEKATTKESEDDASAYEDARSSFESNKAAQLPKDKMEETYVCNAITEEKVVMNETVVISKEPVLNETMVIDKKPNLNNETVVLSKKDEELEIAMSDDDGHTPTKAQPVMKKKATVKKAGKAIFNPYESSPVKSRVEAFEKIATEQATAARVTRSKKNTQAKERAISSLRTTPLKSGIPLSASKKTPLLLSEKTVSAMKASQQEFRERELRRIEKEKEQQKLLAQKQELLDEARRLREEKHIKAQKKREQEELKKQKLLEEHLRKEEERREQLMAEKEEKLKKKAESEKKRLLAAKLKKEEEDRRKLEEERKKIEEERKKKEERRKNEEMDQMMMPKPKPLPIYMTQPMPLLPTDDCYDSDDPESQQKKAIPAWAKKQKYYRVIRQSDNAGHKLKNTLFCTKPSTPDLTDIFQNIDPRKLKRTSSAVWRQPPRFTLLPRTEQSFME